MAQGRNKLEYEVVQGWEQLPEGWSFVEVAGVATDSKDRVYAFNRGAHPMIIFDRDGKFLNAWGEGVFTNPHGIFIGPDDRIYCADNFDHTVRIFTSDGTLLQTLGKQRAAVGYWIQSVGHAGTASYWAIQHGDQCCARSQWQSVRCRWLWECAGARFLFCWRTAVLLGSARHRSWAVQSAARDCR